MTALSRNSTVLTQTPAWLVEYLVTVRHGDLAKMGYVPAGNSGAGFIGRLVMPEVCQRLGERRAVVGLLATWIALQVIFLTVPNLVVDIVVVSVNGFFTAPLFATVRVYGRDLRSVSTHANRCNIEQGINVASKLYTKQEQPAVLGMCIPHWPLFNHPSGSTNQNRPRVYRCSSWWRTVPDHHRSHSELGRCQSLTAHCHRAGRRRPVHLAACAEAGEEGGLNSPDHRKDPVLEISLARCVACRIGVRLGEEAGMERWRLP